MLNDYKKLTLTWSEGGKVKNLKGVIPVVDDVKYECYYQDIKDGKWVPVENPAPRKRQYAAYGKPLSLEQLEVLAEPQEVPEVKMEADKTEKRQ